MNTNFPSKLRVISILACGLFLPWTLFFAGSLKEYILIDQYKAVVELFYKPAPSDLWKITRMEGLDQEILLASLGTKIKIQDLYFDIKF